MYPSWIIPDSQVKEWCRVEISRRVALAAHPISCSWSADWAYIMWQPRFITFLWSFLLLLVMLIYFSSIWASCSHVFFFYLTELVITSPAASFSDFSQSPRGFFLDTPEGFIVFSVDFTAARLDSSSRAKPFLNEYKYNSIILSIVWLCTALDN